jgi:hypothetical protein
MEPYQHQELEPLREVIDQRNRQKNIGQIFWSGFAKRT